MIVMTSPTSSGNCSTPTCRSRPRGRPVDLGLITAESSTWCCGGRAGCAWRDLPSGYGPWKTVYNRHRRWTADGTWERLLAELQRGADAGVKTWDVGIDSTVIRAHQHVAGAPHTPPSDVPCERLAVALEDFESTRARPRPGHTGG